MKKTVRIKLLLFFTSGCVITAHAADASQEWERTHALKVGDGVVFGIEFLEGANELLLSHAKGRFSTVWDIVTGREIATNAMYNPKSFIEDVDWDENGELRFNNIVIREPGLINAVAFHPVDDFLAISPDGMHTRLLRLLGDGTGRFLHSRDILTLFHDVASHTIEFSFDGALLARADTRGRIQLFTVNNLGAAFSPNSIDLNTDTGEDIPRIEFSPDGAYMACNTQASIINLWRLHRSGNQLRVGRKEIINEQAQDIIFSPDSRMLVCTSAQNHVKLYDVVSARQIGTLQTESGPNCVAFNSSGDVLAVGTRNGTVDFFQQRVNL